MSVLVNCPHCQVACEVDEVYLGRTVRCGRCNNPFHIEAEAGPSDPGPQAPPPQLQIGAATSQGRVRARNEDSYLVQHLAWAHRNIRQDAALLVLADGMGGHQGGDEASGLLIRHVGPPLSALLAQAPSADNPAGQLAQAIRTHLQTANLAIHQACPRGPASRGMGTTAVVILIVNGQAVFGHVGDCRVYHHRAGRLTQLTRDHTLTTLLVERGQLTPQQAQTHPGRNRITSAVGLSPHIEPEIHELTLVAGDWLIAACDGLHAHIDLPALQSEITRTGPSAQALAQHLVERTNQLGGTDNCTVLCVRCW